MRKESSCPDEDEDEVKSRQSVDWGEYFYRIREQCPWSYAAWQHGQIDVVEWAGEVIPLENYQARVYTVASSDEAEYLAEKFDFGDCEWLFSYADYGEFGTPVPVIIQQDRKKLNSLRDKLNEKDD